MCHCRIKNLNRGEIGGLNDELQNKRLIISDKDIVLDSQADHQKKSKTMKTVDNQLLSTVFLFIHTALRQNTGST